MHCYLIALKDDIRSLQDADAAFVREAFTEAYSFADGTTWIVGTDIETCAEVLEELGIEKDGERSNFSAVVVHFHDYNGFVERGLWEKVAAWEKRRYGRRCGSPTQGSPPQFTTINFGWERRQ